MRMQRVRTIRALEPHRMAFRRSHALILTFRVLLVLVRVHIHSPHRFVQAHIQLILCLWLPQRRRDQLLEPREKKQVFSGMPLLPHARPLRQVSRLWRLVPRPQALNPASCVGHLLIT